MADDALAGLNPHVVDDSRRIAAGRRYDEGLFYFVVRRERGGLGPDFTRDGVQNAPVCMTSFSRPRQPPNERIQPPMEGRQVTFIVQLHGGFEAATEATDHVLEPGNAVPTLGVTWQHQKPFAIA